MVKCQISNVPPKARLAKGGKCQILIVIFILAAFFILLTTYYLQPTVYAQAACTAQVTNPRVQNGLISAPTIANNFSNSTGICVENEKASFVPYKVPGYEDLKSLYYTQSKANKTNITPSPGASASQGDLRSSLNTYNVILIRGTLDINGNLGGDTKTAVVFVDNDLNLSHNFTFGDNNNGVVFVVGGNVNIASSVTQIDAVIVSSGIIYTAGNSCTGSSVNVGSGANALTVNGSLISLESGSIIFCRTLNNNSCTNCSAEKIVFQPKYLVILRDLFADTLQKWSEIQ